MNSDTQDFLSSLWQGGAYSYFWTAPQKRSFWGPTAKPAPNLSAPPGVSWYFGVNPCTRIPPENASGLPAKPENVRSQIAYVAAINCLFAEFDADQFATDDAMMEHVVNLKPPPSVLIWSGGGWHCYWILSKTFLLDTPTKRDLAARIQQRWVERVGGDKGSKDLARVLRVPGTHNYKEKYSPNYPLVSFVRLELGRRYELDALRRCLPPEHRIVHPDMPPIPKDGLADYLMKRALEHESRNAGGFWFAAQLRDGNIPRMEAEKLLTEYVGRVKPKAHAYTQGEAMASVRQAYARTPRPPLRRFHP